MPEPELPTELWSRIFAFGVNDDLRILPTLLSVNHTFQSIANGTPQLWTRLVFEISNGKIDNRYTRARLRRSGVLPLDVRIFSYETTYAQASELATLIRRQVARIRTLELNVPSYTIAEKILSKIGRNQPAPLLERIHVFYNQATCYSAVLDIYPDLSLENVFPSAPRLTHFDIPADPLPSFESLSLFSKATTVTLDTNISVLDFSLDQVVTFLSCLPCLEHFKFKGVDDSFHDTDLSYQVVSHLLSADVTVPGYGLDILSHLEAPSLTTMRLDGRRCFTLKWNPDLATTFSIAMRQLSDSSPLVKRLELVSTMFWKPRVDYPWIISGDAFPALTSLRLASTDITDQVLRRCTRICTNLKRLELWACRGVTGPGLIQFVQRCGQDFELLLDSCPKITQDDVANLSNIVKVESASNAFSHRPQEDHGYYHPWVFTWAMSVCRFHPLSHILSNEQNIVAGLVYTHPSRIRGRPLENCSGLD